MRIARRAALLLLGLPLLFAACNSSDSCPGCKDIVASVPFAAGESHTYQLQQNGADKGTFQMTVFQDGANLVLKQLSSDSQGNSDTSAVTVDPTTLKPISGTRDVIDKSQRTLLESAYAAIDKSKCATGMQVTVTKSVFKPPSAAKPDSKRSVPACLPAFAYDNDTSLFVWRAIKFEKGYTVTYRTWLTNQQADQIVTLTVSGQDKVPTPAGTFDAWYVTIGADQATQQAWFATTSDHRLLRYNNANVTFLLKQ
ncbi:MAG TPA: hypothetical protein VEZ14_14845 [Dehalococcoidia bacterium]|nr:hypothetical protein [Dehalococcoidia bacterium]